MTKFIWTLIIGFFLYRLFTRFIFPILKITKHTSQHMRNMQQQMNNMQQQQRSQPQPAPKQQSQPKTIEGSYIDFEEIK